MLTINNSNCIGPCITSKQTLYACLGPYKQSDLLLSPLNAFWCWALINTWRLNLETINKTMKCNALDTSPTLSPVASLVCSVDYLQFIRFLPHPACVQQPSCTSSNIHSVSVCCCATMYSVYSKIILMKNFGLLQQEVCISPFTDESMQSLNSISNYKFSYLKFLHDRVRLVP